LGTEGAGQKQFVWEVYAKKQSALEVLDVEDDDLEIFTKDIPFNFAVDQALESLDDPGVLAEVARLQTIVAHVPVYSAFAQSVQELSEAMHKFQKNFNDQAKHIVTHLAETKKRMEDTKVRSRVHIAILELMQTRRLCGKFYWPEIPGIPENPDRHYFRMVWGIQTATDESGNEQTEAGPSDYLGCLSPDY
jgi:hypothetical protein